MKNKVGFSFFHFSRLLMLSREVPKKNGERKRNSEKVVK